MHLLGPDRVLTHTAQLVPYSYDATPFYQCMPQAVVRPVTAQEVARVLRWCSAHGVPVVPRGSGSGLSGGAVPVEGGVVLDLKGMDRILEIDRDNLTATVEPGVTTLRLGEEVARYGLFYPPDPGSYVVSTLGGNVAECSGGMRGLKYGVTRDYVLALEAVLPSGEIIHTGSKNAKDVAGYDLTRLLVGSEGTLAVITQITLRLLPKPESRRTALALFDDMQQAAHAVSRILQDPIVPATLEFMDRTTLEVVEEFAHLGMPTDVEALLLMQQDGPAPVVDRDMERMAEICRREGARQVRVAADEEEGQRFLAARRATLPALARRRPTIVLEDATVPRSRLAEMVGRIQDIARRHGVQMATFGHAGDGNLHPTALADGRDAQERERVQLAFADIFQAALDLGGTITGEHGVGLAKAPYMVRRFDAATLEAMRAVKRAFDPQGILNPGKIFPPDHPEERR
jgi:glycolate oxidase